MSTMGRVLTQSRPDTTTATSGDERRVRHPVIVGVDPAREHDGGLSLASLLGELTRSPIVAVAAHDVHPLPTGLVPPGYDALARERAQAAVTSAIRALPAGTRGSAVESASPARALHELAEAARAAVLVLGSSRHGSVGRVFSGSVGDRVLNGSVCPVAIAPRGYTRPAAVGSIGVGFVKTPEGRAALTAAAALARASGATLEVLAAVPPVSAAIVPPGDAYHSALELARVAAEDETRAVVEELAPGVAATVVAVSESPVPALIELSGRCELLVCGARGYGPALSVLLGSVSRRLARKAHCPLLVMCRGAALPPALT
jgi:nucleotide-binding universal stress UspA family protein